MGKKTEEENQALAAARAAASKQLSSASFQSTSFVSAVIVALLPCCTFLPFSSFLSLSRALSALLASKCWNLKSD